MTIVDFDTEVRIATYQQSDFTRLVARLRNRKPDGWTALWDAVSVYLGGAQDQTGQKVLIVFTDGVPEARRGDGEFYGDERLDAFVSGPGGEGSATEVCEKLSNEIAGFQSGRLADDVTVLVLRRSL